MSDWEFLPYYTVDGIPTMRYSEIEGLYMMCKLSGIEDVVFHDESINSAQEFVKYVTRPDVIFFRVLYKNEIFGFFWLNRRERTHAHIHFTIFPRFWGTPQTVEGGKRAIKLCLEDYSMILGTLPSSNKVAIEYALRIGFKKAAQIPNLIWSGKEKKPVFGTVMYITKRELEDEGLQ